MGICLTGGGSMRPYCQNLTVCIKYFYCIPLADGWWGGFSESEISWTGGQSGVWDAAGELTIYIINKSNVPI